MLGPAHPYRGGIASYSHRLAKEFQKFGHNIKLLTFTLQYPNFLFPGKTQFSGERAPSDLEIERSINSINPLNWIKVGRKISKLKPDIVICTFWLPFMAPCFGTILRAIKKNRKTKIIALIHNLIPHEKRIGDHVFIKYFTKPIDGFIAQSSTVINDLSSLGISKNVSLVHHPIYDNYGDKVSREEAIKYLKLDKNSNYILFFGFIRDYKGLDLLIHAISKIDLIKLNVKLIVAGEFYNNRSKIDELIENLNLRNHIILVADFIPDSAVKYYFGAADLVVQPYKSATQSGISQMAYHFEKPMVVTNVGGLPEIVPDGKAGFVTAVSSSEIAKAIQKFYVENRAEEFKTFIKKKKKDFSWSNMVKSILDLSNKN